MNSFDSRWDTNHQKQCSTLDCLTTLIIVHVWLNAHYGVYDVKLDVLRYLS